jgi:putative NADH-flavin reductase
MKTIALFGVSGRTGKPLLDILLKKGYSVQALVRNPKNFAIKHQSLTIHQGNILTPEDVERTIAGADAVISVIGHVRGDTQPKKPSSRESYDKAKQHDLWLISLQLCGLE